jgi:hypothetical protein
VLALTPGNNADVLFGGDEPTTTCNASCLNLASDTWTLTGSTTAGWTWTQQQPSSTQQPSSSPAPREFAAGASASGGVMLVGGLSGDDQLPGDTWELSYDAAGNTSTWTQECTACTSVPPASFGAAIAYNRAGMEDLLYGGYTDLMAPAAPATTWSWNATTGWTDP